MNLPEKTSVGPRDDDKWRNILPYLDPTYHEAGGGRWDVSPEKRNYLERIARLATEMPFLEGQSIAVLGVGRGGESNILAEVLEERFQETGPRLYSVDYNLIILANLARVSAHERVRQGLTSVDIGKLETVIQSGSCKMITMSSIMHELKSVGGWEGMTKGFSQAVKALARDGIIVMRDFCPPDYQPCEVMLTTDLARNFFDVFSLNYRPGDMPGFASEWERDGNSIKTNTLYAFELASHLRMFVKDFYRIFGEKMFEPSNLRQWPELTESYVLTRRRFPSIESVCEALVTQNSGNKLTYELEFTDDSADDKMIKEHLEIRPEIFPNQRFLATFHKAEGI